MRKEMDKVADGILKSSEEWRGVDLPLDLSRLRKMRGAIGDVTMDAEILKEEGFSLQEAIDDLIGAYVGHVSMSFFPSNLGATEEEVIRTLVELVYE